MRRSLPLLVLLLATAAGCGRIEDNSTAAPDGRPAIRPRPWPIPNPRRRFPPSCRCRAGGSAAKPGRISIRPPRRASPSSTAMRSGWRPSASPRCSRSISGSAHRYGPACRITGIDYRAANEDDVQASLSFLVDPQIAGQFGRESIRAVEAADGTLAGNEITGTEIGTAIKANVGNLEELQAELARVEARLARPKLHRRERARLDDERRNLRAQIAELSDDDGRPGTAPGHDADAVPLRLGRLRARAGAPPDDRRCGRERRRRASSAGSTSSPSSS